MIDAEQLKVFSTFLEKNPYRTPDGRVLKGENALEFIQLFFPEEVDGGKE